MRTSARLVCGLVFDEFELLDLAAPIQALTLAGRNWNFRPFKIFLGGLGSASQSSRSQVDVLTHGSLEQCPEPEHVIVPGGYGARRSLDETRIIDWLKRNGARAKTVMGLGYGVLLLAKAGLLANAEAVVPRDVIDLFKELEPTARVISDRPLSFGPRILTAASYLKGLDIGLELVARELGPKLALGVAAELGYSDYVCRNQTLTVQILDGGTD